MPLEAVFEESPVNIFSNKDHLWVTDPLFERALGFSMLVMNPFNIILADTK